MGNVNWKQAASGNWAAGANWSAGAAPTSTDDATIGLVGNYTVTLDSADSANSLTFDAPGAELLETAAGSLVLGGALTVNNGFAVLNAANTIGGGVTLNGGEIDIGDGGALGSGTLAISGGELLGTADETIAPSSLNMSGNLTIAAAHGTTLTENASFWSLSSGTIVEFGAPGEDGTVVWHVNAGSIASPGTQTIHVRGGTLMGADTNFGFVLENAASTLIDAGATIDAGGFSLSIVGLQGSGTLTDSGGAGVDLFGAQFGGAIAGALSLDIGGNSTLTGSSTYTGTTNIESGVTLTLGNGGATGSLPAASAIDDEGTLAIDRSNAVTLANVISGAGSLLQQGSGTTTINIAQKYTGGTSIAAGMLAIGNNSALGTGTITMTGGELLGTADVTLANFLGLSGSPTIAAAHGTTLNLGSSGWTLTGATGDTVSFGGTGQDGTVVWSDGGATLSNPQLDQIEVRAGTLKAGDANLSILLANPSATTVDAGATIDLAGFDAAVTQLSGSGTVTTSGAAATLSLGGADFAGVLSGGLALDTGGSGNATLSGASTYTGTTKIESGQTLTLGNGGTTGSIAGTSAIDDEGTLAIDRSNAVALASAISGAGGLDQKGTGTTTIDIANLYSGGTTIEAGTLAVGNAGALGSGGITVSGGELLGTVTETLTNALTLKNGTIAAAHGTTLTLDPLSWDLQNGSLDFGATGQDGTVVWSNTNFASISAPLAFDVRNGATLKGGVDAALTILMSLLGTITTTVEAGSIIDLNGFGATIAGLQGGGTIANSSATNATLRLSQGASFAGSFSGALSLDIASAVALSGADDVGGGTTVESGQTLTSTGTFVLASDVGVTGADTTAAFVNNGLFKKTGGTLSHVSTLFTNNGEVTAASGAIEFDNGFTNIGFVQGVLSQSGSVWTVSANAPGQTTFFGGTGDNHIAVSVAPTYVDGGRGADTLELTASMTLDAGSLASIETVQVDNGVTADLSNLTRGEHIVLASSAGGGATVVGTQGADRVDFGAGDDRFVYEPGGGADTIAGFTAGAGTPDKIDLTAIPNLNSFAAVLADATQVGADTVLDFGNGDTLTLQGVTKTSLAAGDFVINPPPHDFNGDDFSDVLWRNDSGQVLAWDMRADGTYSSHTLSNTSTAWQIQDTGDFNGDRLSDILWRNADGTVATWDFNTSGGFNFHGFGNIPNSWHIKGVGDFNGDRVSDVLWQNDDGRVVTWDMRSNSTYSSQQLGSTASAWHIQGTGDFNGDGVDDILWQNSDGRVVIWDMRANGTFSTDSVGTMSASWHVQATGDFNGDGLSDILWRNDNGDTLAWNMQANGAHTTHDFGGVSKPWHVQDTGDFNADGFSDILWRNDNGQALTWDMRADETFSSHTIGTLATAWHVADTNHAGLTIV